MGFGAEFRRWRCPPPGAPALHPGVVQTGHVDDRDPGLPGDIQQGLDRWDRLPRGEPTTAGPGLDSFQQRLWLIAKHPPVQINEEQGWSLSETNIPMPAHGQVRPVLFGEKIVPYACRH